MVRAVVLGAVQGLTEFIPISSSGHLTIVPFLLGWEHPGLPFDVAIHLGTALAVILYFHRELVALVAGTGKTLLRRGDANDRNHARIALLLFVASIPAGLAGMLFEGFFEERFGEARTAGLLLFVTAGLIFGGEAVYRRRDPGVNRDLSRVGWRDAMLVGLLQACAIFPGISRSGATIAAGLVTGLARDAAARFSFLLGLPAILGAGLLQVPQLPPGMDTGTVVAATAVSAATGFAAIAFLVRYLRARDMRPFAWYCVLFGAVALGFWFQVS
ncbi:MAG TPA: undecaprenyl-diphosphate phosphatase [Actinomycetota bacterium]|nr:undecaprenyl-diphosphate phosphatase [Actinomycetota bacterium]